jgi:hypothetical protein
MPSTEGEMGLTIEEYNVSSIVPDGGSYRDHWAVGVGGLGFLADSKVQSLWLLARIREPHCLWLNSCAVLGKALAQTKF